MKTNNKGFSLVELIVVIAIMAILAAVAIPTFSAFINKANVASDDSYASDIKYACEISFAAIGEVTSVTVKGNQNEAWNTITVNVKTPGTAGTNVVYVLTKAESGNTVTKDSTEITTGDDYKAATEAIATIDTSYKFKTTDYASGK